MGSRQIRRVTRALVAEDRLPAACRLALVFMAFHALDGRGKNPEDPPGVYWGGHSKLALEVYGATVKPEDRKRMLRRAIRELEARKLLDAYTTTPDGRVAYRLLPTESGGEDS